MGKGSTRKQKRQNIKKAKQSIQNPQNIENHTLNVKSTRSKVNNNAYPVEKPILHKEQQSFLNQGAEQQSLSSSACLNSSSWISVSIPPYLGEIDQNLKNLSDILNNQKIKKPKKISNLEQRRKIFRQMRNSKRSKSLLSQSQSQSQSQSEFVKKGDKTRQSEVQQNMQCIGHPHSLDNNQEVQTLIKPTDYDDNDDQNNEISDLLEYYKKKADKKILSSNCNRSKFSSKELKNCKKFLLRLLRQNGNIGELLNDALKQGKVLRGQYHKMRILAAMLELRQKSKKTLQQITKDYGVDLSSMAQLAQLFGGQNSQKARRQLSQILSAKLKSEVIYNQSLTTQSKKKYYVFCKLLNIRCLSPKVWRTFTLFPERL